MNKHKNLSAYDTYELFLDVDVENEYRKSKLKSCEKHVSLLSKEFNRKIKILELGSGNSKLLINLHNKNMLDLGWGLEISKSRFDFSDKWIKDLGIKNIKIFNHDLISFNYELVDDLDVCICVDLCLQFLDPIENKSSNKVLKNVFDKLKIGGKLILELDYCGYIIDKLPYTSKIWEEFSKDDPWRYSLWDCSFNNNTNILNWKKTFISREDKYEETEIFLKIFSRTEIETILNKIGFKNIRVYKDWEYSDFENDFGEFIIIAEK
jgi:SAM-dependent methyltransferase